MKPASSPQDARKLQLYRKIIAHSSEAVSIVGTNWKYIERNDAHRTLFGYTDRQLFRMSPWDLIGRKAFDEATKEIQERGSFRGVLACKASGGRTVHVESVVFPVRDDEGQTLAFAGWHRDVGPQRAAEENLRRTTQELRFQKSVLESQYEASPDGILLVGPGDRLISCNKRFVEMWNLPDDVLKDRNPAIFQFMLPQISRPESSMAGLKRLGRRARGRKRDEIRLKDGRTFDLFSALVLADDGSVLGRVWFFRDVTSEKRASLELKRSAEATTRALAELKRAQSSNIRNEKLALMGMLVSGVAHEINNPINVVHGNLTLLRDRCSPAARIPKSGRISETARKCLSAIPAMVADALKAAGSAKSIIHEFRNFARDPRDAEPTDLNRCVEETLTIARKDFAGLRIRKSLAKLPRVRAFHGQMNQVILNLVRNAWEAMNGKGTLTLRTSVRNRRVRLLVGDTGPGVPKEERERIFEPFYTTKAPGRGMGLGLSLSAAIIQNHGGRIILSSRPGGGAIFTIELPAIR